MSDRVWLRVLLSVLLALLGTGEARAESSDTSPFELIGRPGDFRVVQQGDLATPAAATAGLDCQEEQKLLASDGAPFDSFGNAVAASGDVALLGALGDNDNGRRSGSAYVYRWDGQGWIEEQKLTASDGKEGHQFGGAVAASVDLVVVTAIGYDGPLHIEKNRGAAYVYRWDGQTWIEEQQLLASDGTREDFFGAEVAVSGDLVVVGAPEDSALTTSTKPGAAYVYRWDGQSWIEEQKLLAPDGAAEDQFGVAVATTGDVVSVGAWAHSDNGPDSGAAYIYRWDGQAWIEEQKLLASDGARDDYFGEEVAASGDVVVVGAAGTDHNGPDSGAAYIFRWDGQAWIEEQKLLASDGAEKDHFGGDVAISGNRVLVGAAGDDDNGPSSGSAYVFRWDGTSWIEEQKLLASDGGTSDGLAGGVAMSGDVLVMSSDDAEGLVESGSAYVFRCEGEGNASPVCDAGGSYAVECSGGLGQVALDGSNSSDADGDPLSFLWTSGSCDGALFSDETSPTPMLEIDGPPPCPVACAVDLEVNDGLESDTCQAEITVEDTLDPVPTAGTLAACYPTVAAAEAEALSQTSWSDACDADIQEAANTTGTCQATVTVTGSDDCGNSDAVDYQTRIDGEAPVIQEIGYDGMCVWSPDHKYLEIPDAVEMVVAVDNCDMDLDYELVLCESSQPENAPGSGHTLRDCEITPDGRGVALRAERMGGEGAGNQGRELRVTVQVTDRCGNRTEGVGVISIPHDLREHPDCVRSGEMRELPAVR